MAGAVREAQEAMAKGCAAAVVAAFARPGLCRIDGATVVPCLHQTLGVTCRDCGRCRDDHLQSAGLVIAFAAHGSGGAAVRQTLLSLPTV
jgi:hypothetical protein